MAHPPPPPRTTGMSFRHTNAVKAHSKTRALARTILMCIADRCDKRNESWPDMDTLAQEANCTKRSVINALKNIPKDELEIFHRGGSGRGDSNRYRLLISLEQERVKSTTERVKSTTERVKTDSPELSRTISKEPTTHSASGVVGKFELMRLGYDDHQAEIISLWNEKMTPLGWLPVDAYSDEVCSVMEIWNEDDCEEQDFDLAQATALFKKSDFPNPNRTPSFVRFMRDRFKHPHTSKV
jgi:hypothetical protein